jgi:hypothetical protein
MDWLGDNSERWMDDVEMEDEMNWIGDTLRDGR